MSVEKSMSRRQLLRKAAVLGAGLAFAAPVLAACGPTPTPQIVEKVVKETVVVKAEVTKVVEKEITKIVAGTPVKEVVKETVVVEKPVEKVVEKVVTPTPAKKEIVTLRLMLRAGGEVSEAPIYVERPADFIKANPHVQIKLDPVPGGDEYWAKVETHLLAGTLADVMFTGTINWEHARMVHKGGFLAGQDDWMKANGISKSEWIPAPVDTLSFEGKMYGFPKCSHPMYAFLFINHQAFKEAGIPIPETYGNTHEKLKEWALRLSKGPKEKRERFGYLTIANTIEGIESQLRSIGGDWLVDGVTSAMDSKEAYEFASWNVDLMVNDKVSPIPGGLDPGGDSAMFAVGRLAMVHAARHRYKAHKAVADEKKIEWSQILYPRHERSRGWPAAIDSHPATKFTKYPDEAFKLAYAMADRRFSYLVANGIGYLTARVDDLEVIGEIAMSPWIRLQYKAMTQEEPLVKIKNFRGAEYTTTIVNELDKLWLGKEKLTPEFMKSVKKAADGVLAKPIG